MKNAYILIQWPKFLNLRQQLLNKTTIIKVLIVSVRDFRWLFGRYIFKIVATNLSKSDRHVSII